MTRVISRFLPPIHTPKPQNEGSQYCHMAHTETPNQCAKTTHPTNGKSLEKRRDSFCFPILQSSVRISPLLFIKFSLSHYNTQRNPNNLFLPRSQLSVHLSTAMSNRRQLEVRSEDRTIQKWCVSLTENTFESFLSKGNPSVLKVFGEGSMFSPMLFGKFFDPSDAFPLWEFDSDVLLSRFRNSGQSTAEWYENDKEYVLKAELPGVGKPNVQVITENGKIVEISGQWKQQQESDTKDWKSGHWWEYGYVRRLELPESADWKKIEANLINEVFLEIRIPKNLTEDCHTPQENVMAA